MGDQIQSPPPPNKITIHYRLCDEMEMEKKNNISEFNLKMVFLKLILLWQSVVMYRFRWEYEVVEEIESRVEAESNVVNVLVLADY
ncbi:hypothetical protein Tco_1243527 [Tanacetum coccineum]